METIGRNVPCPCGSGKKYKKCCLQKEMPSTHATPVAERTEVFEEPEETVDSGLHFHPYALAKILESPSRDLLSSMSKRERARLQDRWSIAKVARLKTEEIVNNLSAIGIDASARSYLPLTTGRFSAWSIAEYWLEGVSFLNEKDDEDFICLAACELWKRYNPGWPSNEMIDDWITEGYEQSGSQACDLWIQAWNAIRPRFKPQMTDFSSADSVFRISQYFGNWIQDFTLALKDAAPLNTRYAEIGVRVAQEVLTQFVDESLLSRLNFQCDLGDLLVLANRREEGEAELQSVIRNHPHLSQGYVRLAYLILENPSGPKDIPRAIALLEQALAYPVEDAHEWDIHAQLAEMRAKLKKS
jgi:hypothetical protein